MTPHSETRIRRYMAVIRLMVGYMPTGLMRWLQKASLYSIPLNQPIHTQQVIAGGVPCEWFQAENGEAHPVVLYLHGGGFILGVSAPHRMMLAQLTTLNQSRSLMVDYRLAPEHPFPAALEDCLTAYRWLLKQGIPPERIVVAGDSAGGNLTLALLLKLREGGEPLPAAGVCLSPPTDLTERDETYIREHPDLILHPRAMAKFRNGYIADNDPHNPLISPLFGDLRGLPPLLVYAGSEEILCDDAVRLAEAAQAAGTPVDLRVYPRMWHVWQISGDSLPQATQSIEEIAAFIRETQLHKIGTS
ncbi:MAG: alpha/beta hydrolase [Anaerolineae bacterium]|nr:alpha/beta hydrolase [Anaerolineae bacterium]